MTTPPQNGRQRRRLVALTTAGLAAVSLVGAGLSPAHAADRVALKVVGTTDVSDSKLIQNVIEPDFEAAHPDIDLQYTGQGTGQAIDSAKTGSFSALLVHAASLENQFVASGYSAEPYGRSLFWGDYVLVGPKGDPAGVTSGGSPSHDAAGAFAKIAAAGASGNAVFVTRGSNPGTTVQEHAIWALTKGVPTCTVSATPGGGGKAPVTAAADGTACSDTETSRPYPSWYHVNAGGQANNINATDVCGAAVGGKGPGTDCYAFTDRGTFSYLQSQGQAQNLQIVARDNSASATGGADLLVNSFHGYAINPAKFSGGAQVDSARAKVLLDFITSEAEQKKIGAYLGTGRQAGFIPSAAPTTAIGTLPKTVAAGGTVRVATKITNSTPGTPALNGVPVSLYGAVKGAAVKQLASRVTDAAGYVSFPVKPGQSTSYEVRTPKITKIENSTLSPVFGDTLEAKATYVGRVTVNSKTTVTSRTQGKKSKRRYLTIKGNVSPKVVGSGGRLAIYKIPAGGGARQLASFRAIPAGSTSYARTLYFAPGKYFFQVQYSNSGVVTSSASPAYYFRSPR